MNDDQGKRSCLVATYNWGLSTQKDYLFAQIILPCSMTQSKTMRDAGQIFIYIMHSNMCLTDSNYSHMPSSLLSTL